MRIKIRAVPCCKAVSWETYCFIFCMDRQICEYIFAYFIIILNALLKSARCYTAEGDKYYHRKHTGLAAMLQGGGQVAEGAANMCYLNFHHKYLDFRMACKCTVLWTIIIKSEKNGQQKNIFPYKSGEKSLFMIWQELVLTIWVCQTQ